MILLSHPTGNENVRQAALAFQEADLLGEFWTCLNWNSHGVIDRLLPAAVRNQVRRRAASAELRPFVRTLPMFELGRLLFGWPEIDAVMSDLDRRVAARLRTKSKPFDLVYAYEDGALASFKAAREVDVSCVYDLPIGYWRAAQKIYAEEREREPAWAETLTGTRDSEEKLARKEEELHLADHVVVASSFTKQTLATASFSASVSVIPYGAPTVAEDDARTRRSASLREQRLRVLFVGSLGQRKGLSYLLRAVDSLGNGVELTLLGRKTSDQCKPLEAATRRHRWIPSLPHGEVLALMRQHDVLVLPSLFEGFGLVLLEAMAQGLPVITTPHTAGPDLLQEGIDGFIVPIRSAEAIAEKLELLATDRVRRTAMKEAARRGAAERSWADYRARMVAMAREVVLHSKQSAHASPQRGGASDRARGGMTKSE